MGRLDDVTLEELQELRKQTEGEIPRERVLAAIDRKQGDTLETLAERHDVVEKTVVVVDQFTKRWHSPTARVVPDRFKPDDRDIELLG